MHRVGEFSLKNGVSKEGFRNAPLGGKLEGQNGQLIDKVTLHDVSIKC